MDAAVSGSVLVELETNLTEHPVRLFEAGNGVGAAKSMRNGLRWIFPRRTAADHRLGVAGKALVRIEHRPHPG
jgi:hypothetical protein